MKTNWMTSAAFAISIFGMTGAAHAEGNDQTQESRTEKTAPMKNAVELTIGSGYTQGFGDVASGKPTLGDLGKAGGVIQGGAGYRIIPQLALGVYGSWAMFGHGAQSDPTGHIYSSTAGVQADYHFLPAGHELDPWVSLGTGWRGYWITGDRGTSTMHGMELAKLQVGIDYRIDKQVAISPVVGIDLSTFLTQATPENDAWHKVSSPDVNTFVFAGVQGRFDIPVDREPPRVASR